MIIWLFSILIMYGMLLTDRMRWNDLIYFDMCRTSTDLPNRWCFNIDVINKSFVLLVNLLTHFYILSFLEYLFQNIASATQMERYWLLSTETWMWRNEMGKETHNSELFFFQPLGNLGICTYISLSIGKHILYFVSFSSLFNKQWSLCQSLLNWRLFECVRGIYS